MNSLSIFGRMLYPLATAALCLWLAYALYRLYLMWSGGQLTTDRFYGLAVRAGTTVFVLLSTLLWLAGRWSFQAAVLLWLLGDTALAQSLPKVSLPGNTGSDGDILAVFTTFAVYGGRILVLLLSFTGICGISWQLITSFVQARDGGDWGRFGAVFVVGAMVLLFIVSMGQFAWSYLDSLNQL